jgi:ubiquinone/menaquinone biosynthesis C-methylase UbiE
MAGFQDELSVHKSYYGRTADGYDGMNVSDRDEHFFAASALVGLMDYLQIRSVLEVGAGTGRIMLYLRSKCPDLRIRGIEPIPALRAVGYRKGLSEGELVEGNGYALQFAPGDFDLVCCFGVLHHVREPTRVVDEMLRVAGRAVLVSDSNNFGQGQPLVRPVKQLLNALRLWRFADWLRTLGKSYHFNESDGLHYSYSVFDNFELIKQTCRAVHLLGTKPSGRSLYRSASHVAILGIK